MTEGNIHKSLILSLIICILSACVYKNENVHTDFRSLKNSEWNKDSICRFKVDIQDISHPYSIAILIRHDNNYPYRNLWLFSNITTPSGAVRQDTLNCELADDMGRWYGKGISVYKFEAPYEQSITFPQSGVYTFSIQHGMRDDILKNVSEVGIKLVNF